MNNYETTCDQLDHLALRNLRLSNDLMRLKQDLDNRLRDGWLMMAKTRFITSFHRFGTVNLPDADFSNDNSSNDCPQIVVDLNSQPFDEKSIESKSDINMTKFTTRIDFDDGDQKKGKEEMERRLLKKFGGLTPGSLRHSQRTFETVLELVCEIATVESELLAVVDEYKRLTGLKAKYGREG